MDKLRLRKQVLLNGEPFAFATVVVQLAESSAPAKIYGSATGQVPFKGSQVRTDAQGFVEVYVNPGEYKLAVLTPSNSVLFTLDNLQPYSGSIDVANVEYPAVQPIEYATTVTPVITGRDTQVKIAALTGAILVDTPVGGQKFDTLSVFIQASGAGRACTWGTGFNIHDIGDNFVLPIGKQTVFEFVFDGSKWNQIALVTQSNVL
jgi:hypothetical protein